MISIDFYSAVSLYLVFILIAVLAIWLFRTQEKDKDLSLDPRFIWFCAICAYTYINTKEEIMSVCPRCGSYNKKIAYQEKK
ncbi:MAG: hypothetical protein PHQ57_00865 [Candidatus Omnitrophica bacterium]|nr:hypothetical protein [Candidatus Omnitrophota bacterium]